MNQVYENDKLIDYDDEIISIECVGKLETIDIGVSGDNLFYCADILTKNSFGLPATADFMVGVVRPSEDVLQNNRYVMKVLKNRYGRLINKWRTAFIGVDYDKMRLYDLSDDAALDLSEAKSNQSFEAKQTADRLRGLSNKLKLPDKPPA